MAEPWKVIFQQKGDWEDFTVSDLNEREEYSPSIPSIATRRNAHSSYAIYSILYD